jgi:N-methylhydantoinase A
MRYQGQEHSVKVPFPAGEVTAKALTEAIATFAAIHKREYTYTLENPVELVNYHLVATQKVAKPDFRKLAKTGRPLKDAVCGKRPVDFDVQGVHDSLIYERSRLEPGHEIKGPAIVREPDTSIVVPPSHFVTVDDYGNLHIAPKAS